MKTNKSKLPPLPNSALPDLGNTNVTKKEKKKNFLPSLAALFGTKKEHVETPSDQKPDLKPQTPKEKDLNALIGLTSQVEPESVLVNDQTTAQAPEKSPSTLNLTDSSKPPLDKEKPMVATEVDVPPALSINREPETKKQNKKARDVFSDIQLPQKDSSDKIIDQIVNQVDKTSAASILGESSKKKFTGFHVPWSYHALQTLFRLIALGGVFSFGYFYFQLTLEPPYLQEYFSDNIAHQIEQTNKDIKKLKSEENANRYLAISLKLSQFTNLADAYLYKSAPQASTPTTKTNISTDTQELLDEIGGVIDAVKIGLSEPLAPRNFILPEKTPQEMETEYKAALKAYFQEKKTALRKELAKAQIKEQILKQLKDFEIAVAIIDSKDFFSQLNEIDTKNLKYEETKKLYATVNKLSKNEFTTISKVQESRTPWSQAIKRVEEITRKLDPFFGHVAVSDIGTIAYKSYEFSKDGGKITVSGDIKTEDLRNFTLLSKLLDAFERSSYFQNVTMKSFSKNVQEDEDTKQIVATSPLSIDMELEGPLDIEEEPSKIEVPDEEKSNSVSKEGESQEKQSKSEQKEKEAAPTKTKVPVSNEEDKEEDDEKDDKEQDETEVSDETNTENP